MKRYSETIFELCGDEGLVRRGILCTPLTPTNTIIVLAPAGLKYHVGPHRLYVNMARQFAAEGYAVLRFDPLGLGESDGEIAAEPMRDLMATIEQGRFVNDMLCLCRALREQYGFRKIIGGGLCGGAMTAQLTAAHSANVIDGLISIAPPSVIAGTENSVAKAMNSAVAHHHFRNYLRKIFSPLAWKRIVKGESDFSSIAKTVKTVIVGGKKKPEQHDTKIADEHTLFMNSFTQLQKMQVPQFLVFGSNDNRWLEFEQGLLNSYLNGQHRGEGYEIHLIPEANHELFWRQWWQPALTQMHTWLQHYFPTDTPMHTQQQGAA